MKKRKRTNRKSRRRATLIELLVAMSLLSVLLGVLFGSWWQMRMLVAQTSRVREENFEMRYTQYRLTKLFSKTCGSREKDFYFYMSEGFTEGITGKNLVFVYDNGIDIEEKWSNEVLGRLFVDDQERLCLATWPLPSKSEELRFALKKEILLKGVEKIDFEFFHPQMRSNKPVDPKAIEEGKQKLQPQEGKWHTEWKRGYNRLPAMMRVKIVRKKGNKEILFAFHLSQAKNHMTYKD